MANRTFTDQSDIHPFFTPKWNLNDSFATEPMNNCSLNVDIVQARQETWVIPLVVLSTLNVSAIVVFEAYVLYKSCGSRRHLFLGQMLLFGLLLCSLLGYVFVPTPHWLTCAVIRAGVGLAYVIVFATLLVKCVFLLSLHVGVYLSAAYQGLLLFFAIAVQVVVAIQWLVFKPPLVVVYSDSASCYSSCATHPSHMIVSLVYAMLLMAGVAGLAIRARTVPENHGESLYIGSAIGLTIPIWISWILVSVISDPRHHDGCVAFGVVVTSSVVFLVMFLPKGRQLASMSRDGMYADDCFSSVNQSIYTPSFLHIKPPIPFVKQGTLVKPLTSTYPPHQAERNFYVPTQNPSRLWRYTNHPAALQFPALHPTHEDLYWASERYLYGPAGLKLYRSPLY